MDLKGIKARVEAIRESAGDPEVAHTMEDELYRDVLQEIATGMTGMTSSQRVQLATTFAEAALETRDIEFGRWMA